MNKGWLVAGYNTRVLLRERFFESDVENLNRCVVNTGQRIDIRINNYCLLLCFFHLGQVPQGRVPKVNPPVDRSWNKVVQTIDIVNMTVSTQQGAVEDVEVPHLGGSCVSIRPPLIDGLLGKCIVPFKTSASCTATSYHCRPTRNNWRTDAPSRADQTFSISSECRDRSNWRVPAPGLGRRRGRRFGSNRPSIRSPQKNCFESSRNPGRERRC